MKMRRQIVVRARFLGLIGFVLLSGLSHSQIAYIHGNNLYVGELEKNRLTHVQRVCRVWRTDRDERNDISWAPDGRIAIVHRVSTLDRIHYGIPKGLDVDGLWLVGARKNQTPNWVVQGNNISRCPDGRTVAFSTDELIGDTYLYDVKTHSKRLGLRSATNWIWSNNGECVACVRVEDRKSFAQPIEIYAYPSMKLIRRINSAVNPVDLMFSSDGKDFAVHFHLSRPLTGHQILSIEKGTERPLLQPERFAPATLSAWTPNSQWIASDWRTMNPDNDGSWTDCRIGLSKADGSACRSLGIGHSAQFTHDGEQVLLLTDHKTGCFWHKGDLVLQAISGGKIKTLVKGVTTFAVK